MCHVMANSDFSGSLREANEYLIQGAQCLADFCGWGWAVGYAIDAVKCIRFGLSLAWAEVERTYPLVVFQAVGSCGVIEVCQICGSERASPFDTNLTDS